MNLIAGMSTALVRAAAGFVNPSQELAPASAGGHDTPATRLTRGTRRIIHVNAGSRRALWPCSLALLPPGTGPQLARECGTLRQRTRREITRRVPGTGACIIRHCCHSSGEREPPLPPMAACPGRAPVRPARRLAINAVARLRPRRQQRRPLPPSPAQPHPSPQYQPNSKICFRVQLPPVRQGVTTHDLNPSPGTIPLTSRQPQEHARTSANRRTAATTPDKSRPPLP
jgi:hypothetical protein